MRRSERRRRERQGKEAAEQSFLRRRDVILVVLLAAGIATVLLAVVLFAGGGGDDSSTNAVQTAVAQKPAASPFVPMTPDEEAIQALARKSIEVLPQGQWPSLYVDFTADYQQRCPPGEFDQAGMTAAQDLGADFPLLRFKRLENVSMDATAGSATAVIVGEIAGASEYSVRAAFQNVDGSWKIAPLPNTSGCGAFERLPG